MSVPKQYRKKPVVIEAMQFTGLAGSPAVGEIIGWVLDNGGTARWHEHLPAEEFPDGKGHPAEAEHIAIDTLEGPMRAGLGDWIIRGVKGEFYPCKPRIFEATYEPAEPHLVSTQAITAWQTDPDPDESVAVVVQMGPKTRPYFWLLCPATATLHLGRPNDGPEACSIGLECDFDGLHAAGHAIIRDLLDLVPLPAEPTS